ncbi:MAG: RsmD family RNA methyltransferase [Flavobacteriales bacterium]|nr:RsmD family RNA methyltransferase [Flavobacteriales bacterium]
MRIVAGRLKGKRIDPPSGFRGRPTTDFAREALFNVLVHRIDFEGMVVCDLFAGTGAMGIESYSRGAERVVAVEQHPAAVSAINRHMAACNMSGSKALRADVFSFLKSTRESFDLIIADPPFDMPRIPDLVGAVMEKPGLLQPDGLFILEHGPEHHFDKAPWFEEERKYGLVHFTFFRPSQT